MTSSWQKRRSVFNHDWLKNQYLPALAKLLNLIDSEVEDPEFARVFVRLILPQWEPRSEEVLSIIRDYERFMSPMLLIDSSRLSGCDAYTKRWLRNFVHSLWLKKNSITDIMNSAAARVEQVDTTYRQLKSSLRHCNVESGNDLQPLRESFAKFREQCQSLATAMERFPNGIKLT